LGLLAILVALGVTAVNHWAGPWSQRYLRELATQVRTDLMTQVIQPWRFTSPEQRLTVHIRDRADNGDLLGLLMHDARDPKQVSTYLAERGLIIKQDGGAFLRMDKGHIIRRLENEAAPQIIVFDRYAVDLNQLEQRPEQATSLKPRERYTGELWQPDPNDAMYLLSPGRISSELHDRFATTLYPFAFILLVLAFMGQAQTTRQNRMQAVVATFTIATGCRILGIGAANTAVIRPSASFLLYAVPAGAGIVAAIATHWHTYPRKPSPYVRALLVAFDRGKMNLKRLSAPWRRSALRPARRVRV
jgi:lipopolysaccharide export system permease protein